MMWRRLAVSLLLCISFPVLAQQQADTDAEPRQTSFDYDVAIVGGTPGGIMAAIAAARGGMDVVLLERSRHIGGLPANGLGATDIHTRGATGGLFTEFVNRIKAHYVEEYGADSIQVRHCSDGYHFEPRVAAQVFDDMLAEHEDNIDVKTMRQFDCDPGHVFISSEGRLAQIRVSDRVSGASETYNARVFIDATYEGDLAAAAGAPYRLGREAQYAFNEPMAGKLYKRWGGPVGEGSTGLGDNAVQAYNYRLCMTDDPRLRAPITKPANYNRDEFVSLIEDIKQNRLTGQPDPNKNYNSIDRLVNRVRLPNEKYDSNNQHMAFISTDLPEENWPWPTASWEWRDRYAERLRDYTLGLLWFAQNDPAVPKEFRDNCRQWGLAKDEYRDNGFFPRQVYVREGRRIAGDYLFTAHDALPVREGSRPPLHADSITASHYALDSHAVLKREPGRVHLDGFFSYPTRPYTVPYGVIVPRRVENLLTPVPVSGTHIGFSTLRMEPCWMALGQAAGTAAAIAAQRNVTVRRVDVEQLQDALVTQGAVLMYFSDTTPDHKHYKALQYFALRGFLPLDAWEAKLDEPVSSVRAAQWMMWTKAPQSIYYLPGVTTRGELLTGLFTFVQTLPDAERRAIKGNLAE